MILGRLPRSERVDDHQAWRPGTRNGKSLLPPSHTMMSASCSAAAVMAAQSAGEDDVAGGEVRLVFPTLFRGASGRVQILAQA